MGIVQPPWVSKKWFEDVTFNYCDHFGDKKELPLICKICKDEMEWREKLIREGRDPDSPEEAFKSVGESLALAMAMLQKDAEKLCIDLNNLEDVPSPREIQPKRYRIYRIAQKYGDKVERIVKRLEYVPKEANTKFLVMALDGLVHSRNYVRVKIYRALASRKEEKEDEIMREIYDSKTSALLAYMAVDRNYRIFKKLVSYNPLRHLMNRFVKMRKLSLGFRDLIKEEFFPDDEVEYNEFGCDSFNKFFP